MRCAVFIRSLWMPLLFVVALSLGFSTAVRAALPLWDASDKALPSLAPMLEVVNPAVVNISTYTTKVVRNPLLDDPFFRHFFNVPERGRPNSKKQRRRTQSAGSGVIIDADDGVVITNFHVINQTYRI